MFAQDFCDKNDVTATLHLPQQLRVKAYISPLIHQVFFCSQAPALLKLYYSFKYIFSMLLQG